MIIAVPLIEDLARADGHRQRLARACINAAAKRYDELLSYLRGTRLQLPREEVEEGETPE